MKKIDSHQHFWQFNPVRDSWITDHMKIIQRDFMPEDLQPVLQQNDIDGCVAVQADQSETETEFLISLAQKNDFIKGVVGWVDLQDSNIENRLTFYQNFPVVKGFRHILQGEPQRNLMLRPAFKRGIAALSKFGFTYDLLIFPDQLPFASELAASFPNQKFVIDHIAKPSVKHREIYNWKRDIMEIAQHPNVYCKLSGMVTEADWKNWKKEDFTPYMDVVANAFGAKRLMFGSDWPVCLVAASYRDLLSITEGFFSSFSLPEKEAVFGDTASQFYSL